MEAEGEIKETAEAHAVAVPQETSDIHAAAVPQGTSYIRVAAVPQGTPEIHSKDGHRARVWQPCASRARWGGVAVLALGCACFLGATFYALGRAPAADVFAASVAALAGLALAAVSMVVLYGYFSLCYRLDAGRLIISWLWIREIIPLGAIDGISGGRRLGKSIALDGIALPGQYVGKVRVEGLGRIAFYGTTIDPARTLIITTSQRSYAVTPQGLDRFRSQLIGMLESLPPEDVELSPDPKTAMPKLLRLSILRDWIAIGFLAISMLVLLGSFGYVSFRFPELPELIPLHFNYAGVPDLIGPPRDAFRMPLIGLVILAVNGAASALLHQWRKDAGRVLAVSTVFVQMVMLMAVVRVVH